MKQLCSSLREHAVNVIDFEKKKMLPSTKKELILLQNATICYVCRKRFTQSFAKDKNYLKVRDRKIAIFYM